MTENKQLPTLEEFINEKDPMVKKNALTAYNNKCVNFYINTYISVCTNASSKDVNKYYDCFVDQFIENRERGQENKEALIDSMLFTRKTLMTHAYKNSIGETQ